MGFISYIGIKYMIKITQKKMGQENGIVLFKVLHWKLERGSRVGQVENETEKE